jgi:UDP-N-acetylmuramoyl-tripeptide--D-alanyl-D-alanine ligase
MTFFLTITDILNATKGTLLSGDASGAIRRVSTDTRTIGAGDLYVALSGPTFDGHNFVSEAFSKGAAGVLVTKPVAQASGPVIQVTDTLFALGEIARSWRDRFSVPVVGVTGSAGKTTTKDMLTAALSASGAVSATKGNLNNLIGLPRTILELNESHKHAVWEMGMNAFGEIARLTEIARPDVGLITNVGRAHLEGLGSIEGIAKAKGEMFLGLGNDACAVVNADDPHIVKLPTKARKITFGFAPGSDVFGSDLIMGEGGMTLVVTISGQEYLDRFPFIGEHFARNWLAVCAVAKALNVPQDVIREGIKNFAPGKMRGETTTLPSGATLVNDAYNANPESMKASFGAFEQRFPDKRRIVILGEMFELGDSAAALHHEVGRDAALEGMDLLFAVGGHASDYASGFEAAGKKARVFASKSELAKHVKSLLAANDAILVKGSRGSKMEEVADLLK